MINFIPITIKTFFVEVLMISLLYSGTDLKIFKHSFLEITIKVAIQSILDAHYLKEKILYPHKYVSKHLRKK